MIIIGIEYSYKNSDVSVGKVPCTDKNVVIAISLRVKIMGI